MAKKLNPKSISDKYKVEDLESLFHIECTAGKLSDHFTINQYLPASFITKNKLEPLRIECDQILPNGFKRIYSAKTVIEHAISLGNVITKSKNQIADIEKLDIAYSEHEIAKKIIKELDDQILEKQTILHKIDIQLKLSFKRYYQKLNEPLLDEDSVLFLAGIIKKKCGVYFLIKDEKIIYVGQSINIENRIEQHKNTKKFDRFTFVECAPEDLNKLETLYIERFKPELNYNSNGRLVLPMSLSALQFSIDTEPCKL